MKTIWRVVYSFLRLMLYCPRGKHRFRDGLPPFHDEWCIDCGKVRRNYEKVKSLVDK